MCFFFISASEEGKGEQGRTSYRDPIKSMQGRFRAPHMERRTQACLKGLLSPSANSPQGSVHFALSPASDGAGSEKLRPVHIPSSHFLCIRIWSWDHNGSHTTCYLHGPCYLDSSQCQLTLRSSNGRRSGESVVPMT